MQNNKQDTSLDSFVESLTGKNHLRVQDDLGDGFVRLRAAEAQRRQAKQDIRSFEDVVIEMLRNSRDAGAHVIYVATWKEKNIRHLTLLDDGSGIPKSMHKMVFEPFVTSKLDSFHADRWGVHGRGMALYSIRENTDKAFVVESEKNRGTIFHVSVSTERLTEKKDQSSIPYVVLNDENKPLLRGPHNILRTAMEFSIEERNTLELYLGSPVEIAATLYHAYLSKTNISSPLLVSDNSIPIVAQLSHSYNPLSFEERANKLALPLSNRTARRILDGEITPLQPFITELVSTSHNSDNGSSQETSQSLPNERAIDFKKDQRGLKISQDDLQEFQKGIIDSFSQLAETYYLSPDIEPLIHVSKDSISIKFDIKKI